ncbi:hypothetical protein K469DRAFT_788052 [Zopfia rhizophila CBS 207.26]|uniref:Ras-domain-containing protein n=1 Tax=Zopfia rhizophila CBS 207.26 TaxID=1314779 RepID=A0A6A6DWK9_9PEZI|nr:hypothetical protein K469DRAFT_788052 [Zopfia rhizophila CBS 207.26]
MKAPVRSGSPDSTLPFPALPSIVVVGNKSDKSDRREVTTKEVAKGRNSRFSETTAKGSVENIFYNVIQRW